MTAQSAYEVWAVRCLDCGDGLRMFTSEWEARDTYERDSEYEADSDSPHTFELLGGRTTWEVITGTAANGDEAVQS